MNPIQVTAYGLKTIIRLLLGHTPIADAKATMNERLDILGTVRPTNTEKVKLGVLVAGNQGHRMTVGDRGIPLTSVEDHYATDASLYNPMPMAIRPVDDDLPLALRNQYCLRREFVRNGEPVFEYYGIWVDIDPEDVDVITRIRTKEPNQPPVYEPFVPDSTNLFPQPRPLPTTGAVTASDVSVVCNALLSVYMNESQIEEYINAAKIIYGGDERYAVWSEFALCTSAARQIQVQSTQGQIPFMESINTQVYNFAMDYKAVYYNSQEMKIEFDIGNQIPLLSVESVPTLETIGVTIP